MLRQVELKPIIETPADFDELEKRIVKAFIRHIYAPLMQLVGLPNIIANARSKIDLASALRTGRITFSKGRFSGKLNAAITKELREMGAEWDGKGYRLPLSEVPSEYRALIAASEIRFKERMRKVDAALAKILPTDVAEGVKSADLFDRVIWKTEDQFKKSVANVTIPPHLTDYQARKISEEWQLNLDRWVQDFTDEEVSRLRQMVRDTMTSGKRYEGLADDIKRSFGVSQRKAKFLARQETGLLVAKFKESRYAEAGITKYRWRCVVGSKLHPVRPSHKALEGKVFRFDDPPITTAPGEPVRRNNPGEDYNCRCFAIPIVSFSDTSPQLE